MGSRSVAQVRGNALCIGFVYTCMLALAAAALMQISTLPENPNADYSGIPRLSGGNLAMVSHSATIELYGNYALVTSVSQMRNLGGAGSATITIPRARLGDERSGKPAFTPTVTWANKPVALRPGPSMRTGSGKNVIESAPMVGSGALTKGGSYALKVTYRVPLGRAGFDRKQYLAAYDLSSPMTVGTLNVTFKFARGVVFRLPSPMPDIGWQVGQRGAFVRKPDYDGSTGVTTLAFYSGGFEPIGSTGG